MTATSPIRQRAELRGREAVARWRIDSGVKALYFLGTLAVIGLGIALYGAVAHDTGLPRRALPVMLITIALPFLAGRGMATGSITVAALSVAYVLLSVVNRLYQRGLTLSLLLFFDLVILAVLANALWGTIELARVHRAGARADLAGP